MIKFLFSEFLGLTSFIIPRYLLRFLVELKVLLTVPWFFALKVKYNTVIQNYCQNHVGTTTQQPMLGHAFIIHFCSSFHYEQN